MTRFPSIDDLVLAATRALGHQPEVRDWGLLQGALARAQATVFGKDAYPTVHDKAAALLHSLVRNRALVDGNKRLGWVGAFGFYWINGVLLTAPTVDDGEKFVVAIASGELDVPEIAGTLRAWTTPRLSQ
ncbi:type II toxin-antitoxin system death-on-curing family toxin [Saccharopolyspora endophytica]|uniref:Fic family protein n=1 Tax=Saccharopolyspora endophytica TaxID=543886 RepID=A0ABS5DIK5_9PSEU|nr:Fic family protein [Saccharopolyspora endophytica]MBQ0926125.1 Fic family protein [Saccharopolyspora endophytica]